MAIKMFDKIASNNWNLLKYNWDAFYVLGNNDKFKRLYRCS